MDSYQKLSKYMLCSFKRRTKALQTIFLWVFFFLLFKIVQKMFFFCISTEVSVCFIYKINWLYFTTSWITCLCAMVTDWVQKMQAIVYILENQNWICRLMSRQADFSTLRTLVHLRWKTALGSCVIQKTFAVLSNFFICPDQSTKYTEVFNV